MTVVYFCGGWRKPSDDDDDVRDWRKPSANRTSSLIGSLLLNLYVPPISFFSFDKSSAENSHVFDYVIRLGIPQGFDHVTDALRVEANDRVLFGVCKYSRQG